MFARVKVRRVKSRYYDKVWTTEGTTSRQTLSVWAPRVVSTWSKLQIVVGHYAHASLDPPPSDAQFYTFEFVDQTTNLLGSSENLKVVVDKLLPHPVKYTQVWRKELKGNSLYVWKPVAPSTRFIAMGMVCTTTPREPSVNLIRCVPSGWLEPTKSTPQKIWDDGGMGGKKGSIWNMDSFGLLTGVSGYDRPNHIYYDPWQKEFFASERVSDVKWDHDASATKCYLCSLPFGFMRRKHHCRICGHIFCIKCSKYKVTVTSEDGKQKKAVRACEICKETPIEVLPTLEDLGGG